MFVFKYSYGMLEAEMEKEPSCEEYDSGCKNWTRSRVEKHWI